MIRYISHFVKKLSHIYVMHTSILMNEMINDDGDDNYHMNIYIHRERKREGFYVSPFELEWKLAKLSWMAGPPIP